MNRPVPTGDLGLDVILGGGWRLIERLPGRESATVVLRGGPGAGKTLLAIDVALALAHALNGDVVIACVELLPSEYVAQIEAGRAELVLKWREGPPIDEPRLLILSKAEPVSSSIVPRIFCGLLDELDPAAPDLVAALEVLQRDVQNLNGKPAAFVVDSLIGGYGLGPATPRQNVDALMKFAAQQGLGLVLCEETAGDAPTPWDFSADTVLALEHDPIANRQVLVRKHRYGPSAPGVHHFDILGWRQPRVTPRPDAWLSRNRVEATLRAHGWKYLNGHAHPPVQWLAHVAPSPREPQGYACALALVSGPNLSAARKLAFGLVPENAESRPDIVIELDPLGFRSDGWTSSVAAIHFIPTSDGASAAICELVQYLGDCLFTEKNEGRPRRIVLGDVAVLASSNEQAMWVEGIRVIAALVAESGWGIPLIAYDSSSATVTGQGGLAALRWHAELVVQVEYDIGGLATGHVTSRPDGTHEIVHWSKDSLTGPWPQEIAHFSRLPRPHGRDFRRSGKTKKRVRNRQ